MAHASKNVQMEEFGKYQLERRLAYGGMAATPKRASQTEQALLGQAWNRKNVAAAGCFLAKDFKPLDDHRASAWYRATLAQNLLMGFFVETHSEVVVPLTPRHSGTLILEKPA